MRRSKVAESGGRESIHDRRGRSRVAEGKPVVTNATERCERHYWCYVLVLLLLARRKRPPFVC
jgi:hypothetical protein